MKEKFLPIGTVVLLKNAENKIMITSYLVFSEKSKETIFEYGGCLFPIGVKDNMSLGFNHDDIEKIIHMGYIDDEQKEINQYLIEHEEEIKKDIKENM